MRVMRLVGKAVAIATAMVVLVVICTVLLFLCGAVAFASPTGGEPGPQPERVPASVVVQAVVSVAARGGPAGAPVDHVLAATVGRLMVPWSPALAAPGGYRWPLDGIPDVVRAFDPPAQPWLPGHRGVDLAGQPAARVLAAGAGTVAFAGMVAGVGVVSIDHAGGLRTTYEPVAPAVRRGEAVTAGTPIGTLLAGHPGCPAAVSACLHWGLRRGAIYLDPLALLGLDPVRLLPLQPGDASRASVDARGADRDIEAMRRRPMFANPDITVDQHAASMACVRATDAAAVGPVRRYERQRTRDRRSGRLAASRSYSSGWL